MEVSACRGKYKTKSVEWIHENDPKYTAKGFNAMNMLVAILKA